jgi:hypothetical protein
MAVDFDAIRANAADQGIILQEVAIVYEDLTDEEMLTPAARGLVGASVGRARGAAGKVHGIRRGTFPPQGRGVHYLGA